MLAPGSAEPPGPEGGGSMGESRGFGALLREHRLVAGLSQEALAEQAGISLRGLSDLERGLRNAPHPATVGRLAEALGLDAASRAELTAALRRATAPAAAERRPDSAGAPLPIPLSSFVGREQELGEIQRLLEGARLLTLTGSGGIGKTRLALEVTRAAAAEPGGSAAFVELAPLAEVTSVSQTVAAALRVPERAGRSMLDALADAIGSRPFLLVLDNCEHLLVGCAALAESLLRVCARLRVLATSREPLGVAGEVVWRVPSLRVPLP